MKSLAVETFTTGDRITASIASVDECDCTINSNVNIGFYAGTEEVFITQCGNVVNIAPGCVNHVIRQLRRAKELAEKEQP